MVKTDYNALFQKVLVVLLLVLLVVIVVRKFVLDKDFFSNPESVREDEAIKAHYMDKEAYPGHGRDDRVAKTLCLD